MTPNSRAGLHSVVMVVGGPMHRFHLLADPAIGNVRHHVLGNLKPVTHQAKKARRNNPKQTEEVT